MNYVWLVWTRTGSESRVDFPWHDLPAQAMILHLDFETCCELDLKKVGADVYSRHPSLIVTVVAWAWDNDPVQSVDLPARRLPLTSSIHFTWRAAARSKPGTRHLSGRSSSTTTSSSSTRTKPSAPCRRRCTRACQPALGDAGPAIGSIARKDMTAHRLMMMMSKPRKILPNGTRTYWHEDDVNKLDALQAYCEQDVLAERDIDSMIAAPAAEPSRRSRSWTARPTSAASGSISPSCARSSNWRRAETKLLDRECAALTHGRGDFAGNADGEAPGVAHSAQHSVSRTCRQGGDASARPLALVLEPTARRVLEIRQEVAKSSVKKLDAMLRCAGPGRPGAGPARLLRRFPHRTLRRAARPAAELPAAAGPQDPQVRSAELHPLHAPEHRPWRARPGLRSRRVGRQPAGQCRLVAAGLSDPGAGTRVRGQGSLSDRGAGDRLAGRPAGHPGRVRARRGRLRLHPEAIRAPVQASRQDGGAWVWASAWARRTSSITPRPTG